MPYITPADREPYALAVNEIVRLVPTTHGAYPSDPVTPVTGHMNFVFSAICAGVLAKLPKQGYAQMSAIRAALDDASAEFYRRVMAPYEDAKVKENGDVFEEHADV